MCPRTMAVRRHRVGEKCCNTNARLAKGGKRRRVNHLGSLSNSLLINQKETINVHDSCNGQKKETGFEASLLMLCHLPCSRPS